MTQMTTTVAHRFSFVRLMNPGAHWVWLSIVMYVVACFLPAMPPIFGTEPLMGWQCLASMIYIIPAWWANPTYFLATILHWRRRRRAAAILAAIAALLACSFQLMDVPNHGRAIADQEVGCYVWIMSLQILACNLVWREYLLWRQRQEHVEKGADELSANDLASTTSVPRSSSPPPPEPSSGRSAE